MKRDSDGAVLAFADMMKKQIVMPAHLMDDGEHKARTGRDLFADFAAVADSTGTYTAEDYASIMEHLIKRWNIADANCESGEAAAAQEFLMKQPARIRKLAEFGARKTAKKAPVPESFSWIFGRTVEDGSDGRASTRRRRRGRAFDGFVVSMSAAAASHGGRVRRDPWARRDGVASGARLKNRFQKHRTLERSSRLCRRSD